MWLILFAAYWSTVPRAAALVWKVARCSALS